MNLIPVLLALKDTKWQYITQPDSSCTKRSCNIPSVVSILSWDALVIENEVKVDNFPTFLIYLLYFAWYLAFWGCQFSSLLVKGNLSVGNFIINHSDNQVSTKHITLQIYFKLLHSGQLFWWRVNPGLYPRLWPLEPRNIEVFPGSNHKSWGTIQWV